MLCSSQFAMGRAFFIWAQLNDIVDFRSNALSCFEASVALQRTFMFRS